MNDILHTLNDTYSAAPESSVVPGEGRSFRQFVPTYYREIIYQLSIILVLLIFFSFNLDESERLSVNTLFAPYKLAFFTNYLVAAMIINYVFLPILYYKKRTLWFFVAVSILITLVVLVDEYILEPIYFPDTRAKYWPGFFFTIVETLPIIIIMVAFKIAWDFNKKQREIESLKSLVKESQIQFLKSQINPHFLFNNLNNLYAYAIDHSPKTPSIILDLSNVLRYMLYDCKEDYVALSKEIQHLKNYIALYQLQIENRGSVNFHQEILNDELAIPPLILIVFVENAFKHSTGSQVHNIEIDIQVRVSEAGTLTFECSNNYSPHYQVNGTAKGIGLTNVKKRLDLLFPKSYRLETNDDGNTFRVRLEMKLKPV